MNKCSKCGMLKMTDKSKCLCNAKKFNTEKLLKKKEPKAIAKVSEKKKERIASGGSEVLLFKKRFEQLKKQGKNYCMVTGRLIEPTEDNDLRPEMFAHIANKNMYAHLRLFQNNIALVAGIDEHHKFDEWISNYKEFYGVNNLIKDIEDGKEVYEDILKYNNIT